MGLMLRSHCACDMQSAMCNVNYRKQGARNHLLQEIPCIHCRWLPRPADRGVVAALTQRRQRCMCNWSPNRTDSAPTWYETKKNAPSENQLVAAIVVDCSSSNDWLEVVGKSGEQYDRSINGLAKCISAARVRTAWISFTEVYAFLSTMCESRTITDITFKFLQ